MMLPDIAQGVMDVADVRRYVYDAAPFLSRFPYLLLQLLLGSITERDLQ